MLAKGARVQAKLIEAIDADHWIVSFKGRLLQVRNTTAIEFQAGLKLDCVVVQSDPLQFKIHDKAYGRNLCLNVQA